MLLSFEVENFRSISGPITLQMTAVNYYKEAADQLIDKKLPGLAGIRYLRSAAIYGPNASGKTAIWRAMQTMQSIVMNSFQQPSSVPLPHQPFGLDPAKRLEPTRFSVTFTSGLDGVRYEYSFEYTSDAVVDERLCAFPKGHRQDWFHRYVNNGRPDLKTSSHLSVPKAVRPLLNDKTLLVSLLANYPGIDGHKRIRPIIDWFGRDLDLYSRAPESVNDIPYSGEIIDGSMGSDFMRSYIQRMMRQADVGIRQAEVETRPFPEEVRALFAQFTTDHDVPTDDMKAVVFHHESAGNKMKLDLGEESDGTKQLFGISGHIAHALENGSTLFVDEVDASLHPVLVKEIIRTFLDPSCNPNGAQLVFTAHNPCLLENGLLRRDQIWFTEKDEKGATTLYPLSDFSPRKDERIATDYLVGRYSAIPVVPACFGCHTDQREGDAL